LTTRTGVGTIPSMKAVELVRVRIVYSPAAFAELMLWQLPRVLPGSAHRYKYRLAYVVNGECTLRYANESGKGDHRHFGGRERAYSFSTPEKLLADFERDIGRWNSENRDA